MKYFYQIYPSGIVQVVINLPSKQWTVNARNDNLFEAFDLLAYEQSVIMNENEEDYPTPIQLEINDPEYVEAVRNTIRYEMQNKDQYHIVFIPEGMLDRETITVHKETE